MRGDRLLSILMLLQANGRMSAGRLAELLEVSARTIYRDMDALSAAGVPVYAERGPGGGCALVEGYRTDLTGLTEEEARALFTVTGAALGADLGLGPRLEAAWRKVMAALPAAHRPGAEKARQRMLVEASGWMRRAEPVPQLDAIQRAVWEDLEVRLHYRHSEGRSVERVVEPYGLVAKAGTWYLLGAAAGRTRVYRISRIESVEATGRRFERPPGFELANAWAERRDEFESRGSGFSLRLRVAPGVVPMLTRITRSQLTEAVELIDAVDPAGWTHLRLSFRGRELALASLVSFGARLEVVEPASFRAELRLWAAGMLELYSDQAQMAGSPAERGDAGRVQDAAVES